MGAPTFDPFGDFATKGYLRNHFGERDLRIVGHLETAAFEDQVHGVLRYLRRQPVLEYEQILQTHKRLFDSVYPWAGEDRSVHAPSLAISKGGLDRLFAHPADVRRASDHALRRALERNDLRSHAGEIFGCFAYAHPFLEGNGRTLLTIFAELCRRASFHIEWEAIPKVQFLDVLTEELLSPGSAMDKLVLTHVKDGVRSSQKEAKQLRLNFGDAMML